MSVSVVVAIDNRPQLLSHFLDQLTPSIDPEQDELILVADACRDVQTIKQLKRFASQNHWARVISLPDKVGFGRASNIGVENSTTETLVFVNSDVFPEPSAIKLLEDELKRDLEVGAVQGLLIYPQTGRVQSTGHVFSEYLNFHALEGREVNTALVQQRQERQALTAAFYAVRKSIFQKLNGFDEFFFNAWEGMDLTLRITQSGMRCIYTPEAHAFHARGSARVHARTDETQQLGYFWSKWSSQVKTDVGTLLSKQLKPSMLHLKYLGVNCGSTRTWKGTLETIQINLREVMEIADRFESRIELYNNLSRSILFYPGPIVFFADHFEQLENNQAWFQSRGSKGDIIVDLRGNLVLPSNFA